METFSYSATGAGGSTESGTLEAMDRNEAIDKLDRQGLQPLELKALSDSKAKKRRVKFPNVLVLPTKLSGVSWW